MINTPLVSVIIPTYNRSGIVTRAISSVLNQKYQELEIIVVDNASVDNTAEVVNSFEDRRIKFIRHKINKGPAASRNTGIKNSNGEFVAFLDSDDEWLPDKIASQINVFEALKEEVGLIFTNGYNEAEKHDFITEKIQSGIIYNPQKDKFYPLRLLIATPSSWMLPMKVVRDTGYFEESMHTWDDGDYLARVAYKYPLYFLNENLVIWHASESHLNVINLSQIRDKEVFLNKNFKFLEKDRDYLFRFYRAMGKDALGIDKKKARGYLLSALKLKPYDFSTIGKFVRTFGG